MPRQKKTKKNNVVSQIKFGESYTSLFLGIVVVIVIAVLIFSFIRNNKTQLGQTQSTSTDANGLIAKPTTYVTKEGDSLWKISEKMYNTGYNWVDIVSANKISNPDILYVGTKLTIPDVEPKVVKDMQSVLPSIKGDSYVVKEGDNLWDISVRAYGDGFKWVSLAKANNLTNPDLIFPGNTIKITR